MSCSGRAANGRRWPKDLPPRSTGSGSTSTCGTGTACWIDPREHPFLPPGGELLTLQVRARARVSAAAKEDGKWKDNAPQWYDDDLGSAARSWLLIPYIHSMDREHLQEQQEFGRSLIPSLDHYFEHRVLSLEFVRDWGAFCAAAGALRLAYFSEPDPGRSRQAEASRETNNLDNHRRWFAHYYLRA